MSKAVNSKWKKTFPDTIGNQNRPATGVDDTQPFETGAFPQYMANDPVRYDLQNAAMSQSMSNDARLKEMVDARGKELDDHKVDPGAHKTGIAGNAATATKVVTTAAAGASANIAEATMASSDSARIRVSGAENAGELALETADDGNEAIVARQYTGTYTTPVRTAKILDESGNTSFPGTVVAPKFTGSLNGNAATATKLATSRTLSLTGKAAGSTTFDGSANAAINVTSVNADTASKLSTARKINITGNASGSATFDGTSDVSINVSVSQAAHADKATADTNGNELADAQKYMHVYDLPNNTDFNNVKKTGIYTCTQDSYTNRPAASWGILRVYWFSDNVKQEYIPDNRYEVYERYFTGGKWNAWSKVNAANADNATTANSLKETSDRPASANVTYNDGKIRYFLATSSMSEGKPSGGDGPVIHLSWDRPLWETQITINSPSGHIQTRTQDSGTWGNWKTVLDSDNFNNYAPTKTGGGASGTWGINISGNADTVDGYHASDLLGKIYPVGSIYMSMSATNPHDLFGVGTWKRISQGRMLLGADDSTYKAGATGGEATHTLTAAEMPAHSHGISNSGDHTHFVYGSDDRNGGGYAGDGIDTGGNSHFWDRNNRYTTSSAGAHTHTINNAGGGAAHNNMPPYLVCYIWQRTA